MHSSIQTHNSNRKKNFLKTRDLAFPPKPMVTIDVVWYQKKGI